MEFSRKYFKEDRCGGRKALRTILASYGDVHGKEYRKIADSGISDLNYSHLLPDIKLNL